ncbi:double-stranded RNA-binding protein Staufen homolog 2-like [Rhopilema esculentum]|uniref:double-stranded RNA-binding protein Staufen homolog 2-like n=1 Tax=Rhopilema esculentum TaxID=499914 RepID=UPI0031CE592C
MAMQTPCSILNELAKNNKILPIYTTSEDKGSPHQKTFKVALQLPGLGTYEGTGPSIKAAKNNAAGVALQNCVMSGIGSIKTGMQISPTVELNILSMRSGEIVEYKELDPGQIRHPNLVTHYDKLMMGKPGGNMAVYREFVKIWRVAVYVCGQPFLGEGKMKQEARNDAARKALIAKRDELMLKASKNVPQGQNGFQSSTTDINEIAKLHEIAVRNRLKVTYEVVTTNGPSHMMKFTVKCKVGEKESTAECIGKKAAKKLAAQQMLSLLLSSEDIKSSSEYKTEKKQNNKYRTSNKRRSVKSHRVIDIFLDPVTYLTQLLQLRKESIPSYVLLVDPANKNDKKFEIQVSVGDNPELVATGIGSTKKEAKQKAADNLLKVLGIDQKKIREAENEVKKAYMSAAIGLPKSAANPVTLKIDEKPPIQMLNRAPGGPVQTRVSLQNGEMTQMSNTDQLRILTEREGLQILFNDYGKRTESEPYTTHLAVCTVPPVVFQGMGKTVDASREDAAAKALVSLTKNGFTKPSIKTDKEE